MNTTPKPIHPNMNMTIRELIDGLPMDIAVFPLEADDPAEWLHRACKRYGKELARLRKRRDTRTYEDRKEYFRKRGWK